MIIFSMRETARRNITRRYYSLNNIVANVDRQETLWESENKHYAF